MPRIAPRSPRPHISFACADAALPLALCRHGPAIADLLPRAAKARAPARGHVRGVRAVHERMGRPPGEAQTAAHHLAKDRAPIARERGRERDRFGARPAATRAAAIVAAAPHHLLPRVDLAVEPRGSGRAVRDGRVVRDPLVEVEGSGVELAEYVEVRDAQPPPMGWSTRLEARIHSIRIKARSGPCWQHFERLGKHDGSGAAQLQARRRSAAHRLSSAQRAARRRDACHRSWCTPAATRSAVLAVKERRYQTANVPS